MKKALTGTAFMLILSLTASVSAWAKDGFGNENDRGASFAESAALGGSEEEPDAITLNAIAPAAGEPADSAQPTEAEGAKDAEGKATGEMGEAYGDGSERTVVDQGKAKETHDTYGDDKVNVFQQQTDHGAVMDKDTAAGVQVKVLEFK